MSITRPAPWNQTPPLFGDDGAPEAPSEGRAAQLPISVTELNRRARNLIEAKFELLWVSGEISNVLRAASGHWYFLLKDAEAQVRCVMFRNRAAQLSFKPENGMQVDVRALPSLYEARGEFQLGVEAMRRAGLGALFEAFERLKAKLQAEGLFAPGRKRALPPFPKAIGVVTSLQAAALQDVLTTLRRRAPMVDIIIYPTAVQGATAPTEIVRAIDSARKRQEVDVLIVCRGGGSIEDLWSFNAEIVARAVVQFQTETSIPVVSGVGHETDFTISDFVADQRAATPTAAAEMSTPDVVELRAGVASARLRFARAQQRRLDRLTQDLDRAARRLISPEERLHRERERLVRLAANLRLARAAALDRATFASTLLRQRLLAQRPHPAHLQTALTQQRTRLQQATWRALATHANSVQALARSLNQLAPARVLERGYSIVEFAGEIIRDSGRVTKGDVILVRLQHGQIVAEVSSTTPVEPG